MTIEAESDSQGVTQGRDRKPNQGEMYGLERVSAAWRLWPESGNFTIVSHQGATQYDW